jgi:hypothetical protein
MYVKLALSGRSVRDGDRKWRPNSIGTEKGILISMSLAQSSMCAMRLDRWEDGESTH